MFIDSKKFDKNQNFIQKTHEIGVLKKTCRYDEWFLDL